MQGSPEQKQKDIAVLLEKYRQELAAWRQQQAKFEERLELLRERQQALQIEMEAIRDMRQSLEQYKKQLAWQQRLYRNGFLSPR